MDDDSVGKKTPEYLVPPVIAKALISIQSELKALTKSAANDAYGSNYVPLDVVTEKAHELLSARKIAVMQPMITDEHGHAALETILVHESGKSFIRTTKLAIREIDPQKHGSAVTYTRRYALMAMIGITAKEEDDDGNKAAGAIAPVTEEQKGQIETLLKHLKWPRKNIAAEVFKLKSRDSAALAIINFEKIVAEKMRDVESVKNATAIEVTEDPDTLPIDDSTPVGTLGARLKALKLASPSYENKVVKSATGKPFMANVKTPEDFKKLDEYLAALEKGTYHLPAEFYAPSDEEIIVDEPVA
ncbi:ERF family protein [Curtobacterium sp. MCSS17_007]|uniref:ERF family protein n=1 Tax=Curtobacterium sp. MCSS17_007 TaxID=2175646 RepID=UPI000DA82647|nr:ERF family protein [Curtobacterium sp. MCSS17_007]WIE74510.1 ERF family protein [Curtobacterium sp. MCSS17_007]